LLRCKRAVVRNSLERLKIDRGAEEIP
jgi:hypothetical protein